MLRIIDIGLGINNGMRLDNMLHETDSGAWNEAENVLTLKNSQTCSIHVYI